MSAKSVDDGAVILARVSSKSQEDEGYSLDSQLKLLQGYCQKNGLPVVKVFKIAETASKEQSRRVFHELLDYIRKNKIRHLAVEKTDRLTRNFRDAVAIDEWLAKDPSRRLHAVKENLLLHKEARSDVKFMWNIHLAVAKKYTDNLREEAMKGWAEKLAQGWLPSPPPPGYMTVTESGKRIHVPNPETKALVQKAFKLYLETGQSIVTVTRACQEMGLVSRNGRPFPKSYIEEVLKNPFYIGINLFKGKEYPGAQEPIITKEIYQQVQRKMHRGRPVVYKKHNLSMKALIRCLDCGTLVCWQMQKGHYYGTCRRRTKPCRGDKMLRQEYVEKFLIVMMKRLVCPSPEVIDWVIGTMRREHGDAIENRDKLISSIQAQIERVTRMDDTLYDDKLAGEITQDKYEEKHERFMKEKAELLDRLEKTDESVSKMLERRIVILQLSQKAAEIFQHKKTQDERRLLLSQLFSTVVLKNGRLHVRYSKFAEAIADRVLITRKLMEDRNGN